MKPDQRSPLKLAALVLALTGCHKLTQVRVQPASANLSSPGQTTQFQAQQLDADGNDVKPRAVQWTVDPPGIATVDSTGRASAVKSGSAKVRASVGSLQGTGALEVQIPAQIVGSDVTLAGPADVEPVAFQVMDDSGRPISSLAFAIKVVVANTSVATVDGSESNACRLTAVAVGRTQLTASLGKLSKQFNVTVTPPLVTDLEVAKTALKLRIGESQRLQVTAMVASVAAPASDISYSSSSPAVASVDSDGEVRGEARGRATITVTAGQKTASVSVTVKR